MKKLPITKEAFEKSKYFTNKYGKLEYVSESGKLFKTSKGKIMKFKESYDPTLDSAWDEYDEEIPKYLKELDEELYMACTMTDEYRGKHFSTGERELNWDFQSSEDKALHAVVKEIEAEVGEKIDLVDFVMKYISGKELAHRVVDYILERKPGKALARKLAKIGY